jgi:hypothetical protein
LDTPAHSLSLRLWCRGPDSAHVVSGRIVAKIHEKAAQTGLDVILPDFEGDAAKKSL